MNKYINVNSCQVDHFEGSTHVRHRDIEIKCRILDGFIVEQAVDDVVAMKFGD